MIATLTLCVIMAFNVWSTVVFILNATLHVCLGEWAVKVRKFIFSIHQYIVDKMAAQIFGINAKNTDGGEMISFEADNKHDVELLISKIDRLEKSLEQVLARKVAIEANDATVPVSIPTKEKQSAYIVS